jgi:hypothetical protein
VVVKALQYEPTDRFQTAVDMKEALLACQPALAAHTRPDAAASQPAIRSGSIRPVWTFSCQDEIRGTARIDRGAVYFGSYDRCLYALSLESGRLLWKYQSDGGIVSRPAVYGDLRFGSE